MLKTISDIFNISINYLLGKTNVRNNVETFADNTDDDLSEEAKAELGLPIAWYKENPLHD